ncbi:hypothetical protein U1Q18_023312, partial [Sarracenia purpurea var. burkii]
DVAVVHGGGVLGSASDSVRTSSEELESVCGGHGRAAQGIKFLHRQILSASKLRFLKDLRLYPL